MPGRNRTGPPKSARGPKDGEGGGKGRWANKDEEGEGPMTGGKKGFRRPGNIKRKK